MTRSIAWLAALVIGTGALAGVRAAAQETVSIDIVEFSFQPREQIVLVGIPVRWVNKDAFPHSVAMQGGRPGSSPSLIDPGKDHTFVFREPGRFAYRCGVHPTMLGEVIVPGS